jgi:hypothetical protein
LDSEKILKQDNGLESAKVNIQNKSNETKQKQLSPLSCFTGSFTRWVEYVKGGGGLPP